ncbi:cyclase family protein [Caryophanon tenue]|uniref:Kynurenine formamidase n=1 Tax=Caryophanon tenue TaxID=33978 RepID=A0A1C0YHS1_9BACL|nr:cyclase family protein [Caryophanon tenue]OCS86742.1 hypothetical protein A6M13_12330 [Caryophanon tenue]
MWIDITMPLRNTMPVWPEDTPFTYKLDATYEQDGANVGQIQMSVHAGTHVDAPYHYDDFGKSIDALPVDLFIGDVYIVDATSETYITVDFLRACSLPDSTRLFVKTKKAHHPFTFDEAFTAFSPEAIHFLATHGIRLIGTDAPSVDAFGAPLVAHQACNDTGMTIIENLMLQACSTGFYDFIGLPLAIQGGDASPIRAVVQKKQQFVVTDNA